MHDALRREAVHHRGRVDERLERRPRLAERVGRAVELALAVVAPADHGAHRAVGLDADEGRLLDLIRRAVLAERILDRILGGFLHAHVDGGAHRQHAVALDVGFLHLLERPVEEVVGRARVERVLDHVGRMAARADDLALGHEAGLHHVGQHFVGAGARGRQVDVRRVARRRLEQAGEHRRLGQVDVLDRLAEVELGRRFDAEGAAAHVGAVEIELQDLLLGEIGLQPEREEGLLDLAVERALVREEKVLGELLRQRRAALDDGVGAQVLDQRPQRARHVDAEMVEEAPVLGREHRLDQVVGHLLERHGVALADAALADLVAVAVEERDREIALRPPVALGRLEGGEREGQQENGAGRAQRQPIAEDLEDHPREAGDAKAAHEKRDGDEAAGDGAAGAEESRVDPRIELDRTEGGGGAVGCFGRGRAFRRDDTPISG